MMNIAAKPLTRADYEALPEDGKRWEFIEGEVFLMAPAPKRRHQRISANIEYMIQSYLENHPIGECYHAPFDVFMSDTSIVQPDIILVRRENADRFSDAGLEGAPDLIVEILSDSTEEIDRGPKRILYAKHGVEEYWIVDQHAERIEVYRLRENANQPQRIYTKTESLTTSLMPGLEMPLAKVFR